MLLFQLKRCAFYTQIRQLATLHIHGKVQINKHFTEYKYSNLSNPNLSVQRLCSTNPGKQEIECLRPLMWQRHRIVVRPLLYLVFSYLKILVFIDKNFDILEFFRGARKALLVISQALAAQNYEALEDIVNGRTLKLLKHKVDRLTPNQRKLIAMNQTALKVVPGSIRIRQNKDLNETVVEIEVVGMYLTTTADKIYHANYIYIFQRKYKNGIGGSWIVRTVNHKTKNKYT